MESVDMADDAVGQPGYLLDLLMKEKVSGRIGAVDYLLQVDGRTLEKVGEEHNLCA